MKKVESLWRGIFILVVVFCLWSQTVFAFNPSPPWAEGRAYLVAWVGSSATHYNYDNLAVDFYMPVNSKVFAVDNGTVFYAGLSNNTPNIKGYGYIVYIKHDGGVSTLYAHLNGMPLVKTGDRVIKGQQIGVSGYSGLQKENHLHYAVYQNNIGFSTSGSYRGPVRTPYKEATYNAKKVEFTSYCQVNPSIIPECKNFKNGDTLIHMSHAAAPPATPTNLSFLQLGSSSATLKWAYSGGAVSGFDLYDGNTFVKSVSGTTRQFSFNGLKSGVHYLGVIAKKNNLSSAKASQQIILPFATTIGQVWSGSTCAGAPYWLFDFRGNFGQGVTIRAFHLNNKTLNPTIKLERLDSLGMPIQGWLNSNGWGIGYNAFLSVKLPANGYYRMTIAGEGGTMGDFRFIIEPGIKRNAADANFNGAVNTQDYSLVVQRLGLRYGQSNFQWTYDINLDGTINSMDLNIIRQLLGQ